MSAISEDTRRVKEEFERLSTPTQVFIAVLVGLGVLIGLLLGAAVGYGISVDEIEGRDCIVHEDREYCAEQEAPAPQ